MLHRSRTRRGRLIATAALATLAATMVPAGATTPAPPSGPGSAQRVIMPTSCQNTMHRLTSDGHWWEYAYTGGQIRTTDRGMLSYGGVTEAPKSFTEVRVPGASGEAVHIFSLRANGELWTHRPSGAGSTSTLVSTRWSGITRIVGVDNGILYAVTASGGLNAYRTDGATVRSHDIIGTKGWTALKSLSGYARADGLDSLVAVTSDGELVDFVIAPSGATRRSYQTYWKAGISQVSVGECTATPGRPIFAVIGSSMYAYYDRDAAGPAHTSLNDLSTAHTVGAGWTGLIS